MIILIRHIIKIIILTAFILSLFTITTLAEQDNTQINELDKRVEHLESESKELKSTILSIDKDKIISSLENKESNLIASADHAINRINFWIAVFSIGVTVSIAVGSLSTYFLQKARFDKLEKDIEEYKTDLDIAQKELTSTRNELAISVKEFELVKSESQDAAQCAASTQEFVSNQITLFEENYNFIKLELESIQENVRKLAEKAKESEDKAKESEIKSKASEYFNKALNSNNSDEQIVLYTKTIESDSEHDAAYNNRGNSYSLKREFSKALDDYNNAIRLNPEEGLYYRNRAGTYADLAMEYKNTDLQKFSKFCDISLKDFHKSIELTQNDNNEFLSDIYNDRGNSYRRFGNIELALQDINKSIEENNKNGYAYSTLAEIYAIKGDDDNFYKNIKIALINNCPVWELVDTDPLYNKYRNSSKFIKLINTYKH